MVERYCFSSFSYLAILFLIVNHMYKTNWDIVHGPKDILVVHKGPFTGQGHKRLYENLTKLWHAQLSLNLAMLSSSTIVVDHRMYSMPPSIPSYLLWYTTFTMVHNFHCSHITYGSLSFSLLVLLYMYPFFMEETMSQLLYTMIY